MTELTGQDFVDLDIEVSSEDWAWLEASLSVLPDVPDREAEIEKLAQEILEMLD